jgi:hypothetical protein
MPLNPNAVYQLSDLSDNYVRSKMIVMGVKPTTQTRTLGVEEDEDGGEETGVIFITNTEQGHYILGEQKDTEGGVQIVDADRVGDDGEPVVWEFRPLTMELFDAMGPSISGFEELRKTVNTEELLHTFFIENFLPDDWFAAENA